MEHSENKNLPDHIFLETRFKLLCHDSFLHHILNLTFTQLRSHKIFVRVGYVSWSKMKSELVKNETEHGMLQPDIHLNICTARM